MINIVLFEPEIPPNTGNIGRLCHAMDLTLHLIEPLGFALDERSLRRAGLDYWEDLQVQNWSDFPTFLENRTESGRLFYLTTKTDRAYWDEQFQVGDYLVFGPETRGIPESILGKNADHCLTIPQRKGRSLNLATSVGIVAFEAIRQLRPQFEL